VSGRLAITNSTVSNNSAPSGGGIQASNSAVALINVTFAKNAATAGPGGAVTLWGGYGKFTNCTLAGNSANGGAKGIGAALGGESATLEINNTIFDGNITQNADSGMSCETTGTGSGSSDLQWPQNHVVGGSADIPCVTGITFADANLGPLQLQSASDLAQTMLPAAGSPAIGLGRNCPATDQRGKPRPATGCTAGAVEVQ
jgi:hypothetical protein